MIIKSTFLYFNPTKIVFNIVLKNWHNYMLKSNIVHLRKCITQFSFQTSANYKLLKLYNKTNVSLLVKSDSSFIDESNYDQIADETLDTLSEKLEVLLDKIDNKSYDIMFNNGVITLALDDHGTYVINKQTPNKQIWLSSPISGPKRYDYVDGNWVYKYDGQSLHDLLKSELEPMFSYKLDL